MESEEDSGMFPLSRSWDDIEGARSILNLNSPNGFHPIAGAPPPISFSLPTASSMPSFPPHHGSMLSASFGSKRPFEGVPPHPVSALAAANATAGSS
jgi:hypothetical protein